MLYVGTLCLGILLVALFVLGGSRCLTLDFIAYVWICAIFMLLSLKIRVDDEKEGNDT